MSNRLSFAGAVRSTLATLLLTAVASAQATFDPAAGLTRIDGTISSAGDIQIVKADDALHFTWAVDGDETVGLALSLDPGRPLIRSLSSGGRPLVENVDPAFVLTVGTRDLKPAGWIVFFDNPPRRPYETHPLRIARDAIRIVDEGGHKTIVLNGAAAGPFSGEIRFTIYPGSRMLRMAAVLSTDRPATAFLFDAGLIAHGDAEPWKAIAWTDLSDQLVRVSAKQSARSPQVRHRTILAEGDHGSVAIVPPPHQFFYPLDEVDNCNSAWVGTNYRGLGGTGFGVRQTIEGDRRFVPWVNAPPGTRQDCGVFLHLSANDAGRATGELLAYTRDDTFKPLPGYKTFTSHYHVEHAVKFATQQKFQAAAGVPAGLETPEFVERFKRMGVNAVHLAEFHLPADMMKVADRLTLLNILHDECERLSDESFLLLPGEEPNVHLGGHWLSFFPKPVYWTLDRKDGQPFVEEHPAFGKVYHVGNADDVLKLMEAENGLMWTAHARIKSSTGFPDVYRDKDYFQSDRFLGAAWKAMPADYSTPRLGVRVLDLLDDMANWGTPKQVIGEVDVFAIDRKSELYAHMNINYLRLDALPRFADGWQPILDAIRGGEFFTTTGEVLIPAFTLDGKSSGETLPAPTGISTLRAEIDWTFPLAHAELISGDGRHVYRKRIDLRDTKPFGTRELELTVDLRGRTWARLEVWDVAANGAFTQPIRINK